MPAEVAELYQDATHAAELGDWARAARLYAAVLKQAPDHKLARLRYGVMLVLKGNEDEGRKVLDEVLLKPDSEPLDLAGVARGLQRGAAVSKRAESPLIARYNTLAFEHAQAAGYAVSSDLSKLSMFADLALETGNDDEFRSATARLVRVHPDAKESHYFNALRATNDKDWVTAENEIRRAGKLGLSPKVVEYVLASGIPGRGSTRSYLSIALWIALAWVAGLGVLFFAGKLLSAATLRSAQSDDPNAAITSVQRALRRLYRVVINVAALYYYLSLPFVAVLALGAVVILGFVVLKMPRIPVKVIGLIAVFGFAMLATVWSSVRSLFVRIKDEDPGRALNDTEAPGLWAVVREVAAQVGTRPVDAIFLTPGTELAVFERGRWRDKMRDRAQRALILGQGVIDGFRLDPFRAVMAHEYGHFLHRDTAGGDVALRVNATIGRFATAMLESGHAAWWNIGWQFVRLYHLLFRRITHGASRLQEINADRVAARAFGKEAFEEGLNHVIHRDVALRYQQAIARQDYHGDKAEITSPDPRSAAWFLRAEVRRQIENDVTQLWNAKTTEDDTHPCPADRIRLIGRLATGSASGNGGGREDHQLSMEGARDDHYRATVEVEELFADPARLRAERADYLAKDVKEHAEAKKAYCTHLVAQIDEYLAEHPGLSDPVRERGNLRMELNDLEGAVRDYSEAIRLDGPNPALSYFGRGLARRKLGELAAAAADLRQAIKLDPSLGQEKANGWVELGEIMLRMGDPAAAVAEYDRVIERHGRTTEIDASGFGAYLRRGEAFAAAGDHTRAEADFTRALELDPRCAEALAGRARVRSAQGRQDEAAADALAATRIEPELGTPDDFLPGMPSISLDSTACESPRQPQTGFGT